MPLFELRTSRDMFDKANREHSRLTQDFHIDHIFNFFVTAYHIQDYVRRSGRVAQSLLEEFLKDKDLKSCRDLCDQGKHFILTRRPDPSTQIYSSCFGGSPIGALPIGGGNKWVLRTESGEVDVQELANRVLEKWGAFLEEHQL